MRPGRPEWAQLDEMIGGVGLVEFYCSYTVEFGCSYLVWFVVHTLLSFVVLLSVLGKISPALASVAASRQFQGCGEPNCRVIPIAFNREDRVVGRMPSNSAAPRWPDTLPPACCKARMMLSRS